jgi:hypothetical protein
MSASIWIHPILASLSAPSAFEVTGFESFFGYFSSEVFHAAKIQGAGSKVYHPFRFPVFRPSKRWKFRDLRCLPEGLSLIFQGQSVLDGF